MSPERSFLVRFALVAGALAIAAGAHATTYRWKDPATGRTIISDQPPPAGVQEIGKPRRTAPAAGAPGAANLPLATRRAMAEFPVVLFTADDCLEACADARGLLNGRGVPFTELNVRVEANLSRLEAYGEPVLPTLLVGRQALRGLHGGHWHEALGLAGYPQTAPPGYRPPPAPAPAAPAPAADGETVDTPPPAER